jgi:hypothetical protein
MNNPLHLPRRDFLRYFGIASGALTLSPFFLERFSQLNAATAAFTGSKTARSPRTSTGSGNCSTARKDTSAATTW